MNRQLPHLFLISLHPHVVAAPGGCSIDRHVFESTVWQPTTLRIETPVEHDLLWEKRIPVGYKLAVDFSSKAHLRNDELDVSVPVEIEPLKVNMQPATKMVWRMYPVRETPFNAVEKGEVILPGVPIVMKIEYRDGPEYPSDYSPTAAAAPTAPPATYEQAATQPAADPAQYPDPVDTPAPAPAEDAQPDEPAAEPTDDTGDALEEIDAALDPQEGAAQPEAE